MLLEDEDSEDSFGDIDSDDEGSEEEKTEKPKPTVDLKVCLTLNYISVTDVCVLEAYVIV